MFDKLARWSRNLGPASFFVPAGIILIIFGALLIAFTPKEYNQTTGTISHIESYPDADGEMTYDLTIDYTVDGKAYTATFSGEFANAKEGDTVDVFYDPSNPEAASNTEHGGIIGIVMIVAGAASTVYGVYASYKAFKKSKELDDQIKEAAGTDYVPEVVPLPKGELTEYYVRHDGNTLRPGYIMEDEDRDPVFEAPMTKQALVGARIFTFKNHVTGETKDHEVGHTVTQTYNNGWYSMKSWFKFDGKNIWDVLHDRGVRISTDLVSALPKARYTVSINGTFAATIESSSQYVHEEDEAKHKIAVPVNGWYYRVWTNETDIETIFLTVFAISETEQAIVE